MAADQSHRTTGKPAVVAGTYTLEQLTKDPDAMYRRPGDKAPETQPEEEEEVEASQQPPQPQLQPQPKPQSPRPRGK